MSPPDRSPRPTRGEIWEVDWSPGRGSEQAGVRPALIIQNHHGNHSARYPNAVVAAVSTKGRDIPFHVFVARSPTNGLRADSYARCEQILTISKLRLVGSPWGRLTDDQMAQVDEAVKRSLA